MDLKKQISECESDLKNEIEMISEYIFEHPELGNHEFESSSYLVNKLKEHGFEVTYPYLDIETAFRAEYKCDDTKLKIAFLAEYDALPGYGPGHDQNAHACGHNWIAASTLGAAITLSKLKDKLHGTIVLIGTPAEETTGGKCELVDKHAFDDIDGVIQMHLGAENNIDVCTLAMDSIEFRFHGKASHAAAYPQLGINALDGVMLTFAGINALRQHIESSARIAGIVCDGGQACNTVPDYASCRFYIRAKKRSYLKELTKKVIDCARGASLMTGAAMDYSFFENSYDELVYDAKLKQLLKQNLTDLGVTNFVEDLEASGSSDIGNVSQVCPTVYCEIDTSARPKVYAHSEEFLNYVHGPNALHTLHTATIAMAKTATDIMKKDI